MEMCVCVCVGGVGGGGGGGRGGGGGGGGGDLLVSRFAAGCDTMGSLLVSECRRPCTSR